MSGHGHVYPNEDGSRARCGGPLFCEVCALDAVRKAADEKKKASGVESGATNTIAEALARVLEADPHQWGHRPCSTCTAASALLGRPFGCSAKNQ
jgi:peptide methionine sulfoxide reductase MsrB